MRTCLQKTIQRSHKQPSNAFSSLRCTMVPFWLPMRPQGNQPTLALPEPDSSAQYHAASPYVTGDRVPGLHRNREGRAKFDVADEVLRLHGFLDPLPMLLHLYPICGKTRLVKSSWCQTPCLIRRNKASLTQHSPGPKSSS